MRNSLLLALVALVCLALAGVLHAAAPPAVRLTPTASPTPNTTLSTLSRLSGPAFDKAFMRELIPIHEEAVEIAMAATLHADHTELLRWNQVMIDRKSGQVRQMLAWLQEAGVSPGRRNVGLVTEPVKKMRSLRGAALERAYLPLIVAHLEWSTSLAQLVATKADRPELGSMAQAIVAVEVKEVARLRAWQKAWYP
ncbi:MAG: DUF305 domain-containing protein [bacterium]|nr:DUF305 domain-containing protein [bacterium]